MSFEQLRIYYEERKRPLNRQFKTNLVMTQDEFFEGYSIPRNKELMRIFKDLEMVEQLGRGIHRILKHYGKDCFHFTENFTRLVFPNVEKGLEKELGARDRARVRARDLFFESAFFIN